MFFPTFLKNRNDGEGGCQHLPVRSCNAFLNSTTTHVIKQKNHIFLRRKETKISSFIPSKKNSSSPQKSIGYLFSRQTWTWLLDYIHTCISVERKKEINLRRKSCYIKEKKIKWKRLMFSKILHFRHLMLMRKDDIRGKRWKRFIGVARHALEKCSAAFHSKRGKYTHEYSLTHSFVDTAFIFSA